jgi:phage-related baseplate assembly protein
MLVKELSALPSPQMIEELSYAAIFSEILAEFQKCYPEYSALLESDPAIKILEVAAYRELLLRNRINEAARGQMLAFSTGTDLDHLGAFYAVFRLEAESDNALRQRVQQRIRGFANAGGAELYRYWALTASPEIADVAVTSPRLGHVLISILSRLGDGTASEDILQRVRELVMRDDIRVLTDTVHIQSAEIIPVTVYAKIWLYPETLAEMLDSLTGFLKAEFAASASLGFDITCSWLIGRLQMAGVHKVELLSPLTDVRIESWQVARLAGCRFEYAGRDR